MKSFYNLTLSGGLLFFLFGILLNISPSHGAPHRPRQSRERGDKYIVGVGKADITGLVENTSLSLLTSLANDF